MLETGIKAPDFTLPDKDGKLIKLSDFLGKKSFFIFIPRITRPAVRGRYAHLLKSTLLFPKSMPSSWE